MCKSLLFLEKFFTSLNEEQIPLVSLRYKPYTEEMAFSGDYDYVCASKDLNAIFQTLFTLATQMQVNFTIDRVKYGKSMIRIYDDSNDESILLEIWNYLDLKSENTLKYMFWEDIEQEVVTNEQGEFHFTVAFEALFYLSHLYTKNKDLSVELIQKRLRYYIEALKNENESSLVTLYERLLCEPSRLKESANEANELLVQRGLLFRKDDAIRVAKAKEIQINRAKSRLYAQLLKKRRVTPVVGPDGVGKTSIIESLQSRAKKKLKMYRFKKLFRHTILYKIAALFLKKEEDKKLEKNQYDDKYGKWMFTIALVRFPLFMLSISFSKKFYFSDRYFHDLLIKNARFMEREATLREGWQTLLKKSPNTFWFIHLDAPNDVILSRKQELSSQAIDCYREKIFAMYLLRPSLLYSYVNTSLALPKCTEALYSSAKVVGIK